MIFLGYFLAIIIGLVLGTIGGGGSILSVPVLVYLMQVPAVEATGYSLFIVGVTASIGTWSYYKKSQLLVKTGLLFALPSIITVYATRKYLVQLFPENLFVINNVDLTQDLIFIITLFVIMLMLILFSVKRKSHSKGKVLTYTFVLPAVIAVYSIRTFLLPNIPEHLIEIENFVLSKDSAIMILFGLVTFIAGYFMLKPKKEPVENIHEKSQTLVIGAIVLEGVLVGTVTGIIGAGGGFLIIPALVTLVGIPLKKAIGTSLMIISFKSLIGFLGDIQNTEINWPLLIIFTTLSCIGMIIGVLLSSKIPENHLKKAFAYFLIVCGSTITFLELV